MITGATAPHGEEDETGGQKCRRNQRIGAAMSIFSMAHVIGQICAAPEIDEIEKRLQSNTSDHWIEALNEAGVACGRINNVKEVFEEPQLRHLGMLKKVTSRHLGEQTLMGQPLTLTRTPSTIARAAPRRGEHTEEILSEIGYAPEQLKQLKSQGVF